MFNGTSVTCADTTKFLGVIFDSHLTWKPHINMLVKKLNRNSAVISKIRENINSPTALQLYNALILPHISYCAIIWASGSTVGKLHKIHLIQKRVLRKITLSHFRSPSKPIFLKLGKLTIYDIYNMQVACFVFQNLHGMTPKLLPNYFQTNIEFHSRSTRTSENLHVSYCRTGQRQVTPFLCPTLLEYHPKFC